ncbi:MAG: tetratricopeptide repeat protein [Nitrospirae bacterium]|nr:tetratricopeptide repeat protein [Nitrospirota bacterium]
MKKNSRILSFVFLIFLTGAGIPLFAASPSRLVEEGNRLYREGKYNEAIRKYEKASVARPESPRIYFNKGNAYLAEGNLDKARKLLRQAAQKATNVKLEARAKYNLGNLAFQEAKKYQDKDPQKALSKLEESTRLYRETLDLDSSDEDAKYNLEVARILMKDILDKLKKQQEKQKARQKKANNLAKKLKELIAAQGEELKKTKELETRKAAGNKSPDKVTESTDKELKSLTERQGKTREKTGKLTKELRDLSRRQTPSKSNRPFAKIAGHTDKANLAQALAENELRKGKLPGARANQEEALQELNKALDLLKKPASPPPSPGGNKRKKEEEKKGKQKKGKQKGSQQTGKSKEKKEGLRKKQVQISNTLARDILEQEKKNRELRNLPQANSYQPVDKDW